MADRIRAGIVGTGFMGTVHAGAVRSAGAVSRIVASTPESSPAAGEREAPQWVEVVP